MGLISIKGARDGSHIVPAILWLNAVEFNGFVLSAQGRTPQPTIRSTELVAGEVEKSGSMKSFQHGQDPLATLRQPAPGTYTCYFSILFSLSMWPELVQGVVLELG